MRFARRAAIGACGTVVILATAAVLPWTAGAASPERDSKPDVVTRRDEGGLAEAVGMVKKITVSGDRAVITYRAAGEKRPRHLVVEYSAVASAMLYGDDGPPLYWTLMALVAMGLAARLARLNKMREEPVPELARRRIPPADR